MELEKAGPGEIVAVVGLKQTYTGQHAVRPGRRRWPWRRSASRSRSSRRRSSFGQDARRRQAGRGPGPAGPRRPDAEVRTPTRRRRTRSSRGMGELHLEISHREAQAGAQHPAGRPGDQLGKPRVAYRQTLAQPIDLETRYIKQTGGRGKFAVINVQYTPLDAGGRSSEMVTEIEELEDRRRSRTRTTSTSSNEIIGGVDPEGVHPVGGGGLPRRRRRRGTSTPSRSSTWSATLHDGKYHDVDSSQDAFYLAADGELPRRAGRAGITLLEPIMKVVVVAPEAVPGLDHRRHQPPARR